MLGGLGVRRRREYARRRLLGRLSGGVERQRRGAVGKLMRRHSGSARLIAGGRRQRPHDGGVAALDQVPVVVAVVLVAPHVPGQVAWVPASGGRSVMRSRKEEEKLLFFSYPTLF